MSHQGIVRTLESHCASRTSPTLSVKNTKWGWMGREFRVRCCGFGGDLSWKLKALEIFFPLSRRERTTSKSLGHTKQFGTDWIWKTHQPQYRHAWMFSCNDGFCRYGWLTAFSMVNLIRNRHRCKLCKSRMWFDCRRNDYNFIFSCIDERVIQFLGGLTSVIYPFNRGAKSSIAIVAISERAPEK